MKGRKEELNEDFLARRVKETGGEARKFKWPGRRGGLDRFVGWPALGVSVFVELKEETQSWGLQPHQRREIEWLRGCGQRTAVLSNKAEIEEFIQFHTGGKL